MQSFRALLVVPLASVLAASEGGVAHGAVALAVDTPHKNVVSVAELVAPSTGTILSEGRGSVLTCTARPTAVDLEGDQSALATWLNVEGDPSALATWPIATAAKTLCAR